VSGEAPARFRFPLRRTGMGSPKGENPTRAGQAAPVALVGAPGSVNPCKCLRRNNFPCISPAHFPQPVRNPCASIAARVYFRTRAPRARLRSFHVATTNIVGSRRLLSRPGEVFNAFMVISSLIVFFSIWTPVSS
jgi:hypothetical protein